MASVVTPDSQSFQIKFNYCTGLDLMKVGMGLISLVHVRIWIFEWSQIMVSVIKAEILLFNEGVRIQGYCLHAVVDE